MRDCCALLGAGAGGGRWGGAGLRGVRPVPGAGSGPPGAPQEQLRLGHAGYLRQHPDARALVSDFLLFLLVRQPQDAVTFAAEFFGFFSANRSPSPALRSSHPRSPFRPLDPEDGEDGEDGADSGAG